MATTTTFSLQVTRGEFTANNGTGGSQNSSNVIGLAGGGFALTYGTENGANDVPYLTVYDSPLAAADPLFLPYDVSITDMRGAPVLTQLSNGNVVIGWHEGSGGSDNFVFTIYDPATGLAVGLRERELPAVSLADPEITALQNGGFVVSATNGGDSMLLFVDANGTNPAQVILIPGTSDPSVTQLNDTKVLVSATTAGGDIVMRFVDQDGTNQSPIGTAASGGNNSSSQVAALKNGGFAIVYDDNDFGGEPGIALRLYDSNGITSPLGNLIRVDLPGPQQDADPELTVLENGYIAVTWTHVFGTTDDDVRGAIFTPDGTRVLVGGNQFFTLSAGSVNENQTSVAALLNGMFVATWTDEETDGSGTRISGVIRELTRTTIGDAAADDFQGDALRDTIFGGGGADLLFGGGGNDTVRGEAGDDTILVSSTDDADGADTLDGGGDFDTLVLDATLSGNFIFDLSNDTITSIERVSINPGFSVNAGVTVNASQFGTGLALNCEFTNPGAGSLTQLYVFMDGEISINLGNLQFFNPYFVQIFGDDDAETITGTSQNDEIFGAGGADVLNGGLGDDSLAGGAGDDVYVVNSSFDQIFEEAGEGANDLLRVGTTNYTLANGEEIERINTSNAAGLTAINITGNDFAQRIDGNAGNNILRGRGGADQIFGAGGIDTVSWVDATASIVFTLGATGNGVTADVAGIGVDTISGIENITAGAGDDTITGNAGANVLRGEGGADRLIGGLGDDTLDGGADRDTADWSAATAAISFTLNASGGGTLASAITGIGQDTLAAIENLIGGSAADTLTGNAAANTLRGGNGGDTLTGGAGIDSLRGEGGSDFLVVNEGDDLAGGEAYDGGADGFDRLTLNATGAGTFGLGNDTLTGLDELIFNSTVAGSAIAVSADAVDFGAGILSNAIFSNNNSNTTFTIAMGTDTAIDLTDIFFQIFGGTFTFRVNGDGDAETITGSARSDIINGGLGDDILAGDAGDDQLTGGGGGDTFTVEAETDQVFEAVGGGIDLVKVTDGVASYTLADGQEIETLTAADVNSTEFLNLIGNGFGQTLIGNNAANNIEGGAGADVIYGNGGADFYLLGEGGDDTIYGGEGGDFLDGGDDGNNFTGHDQLFGEGGDDQMDAFGGNDLLDGGSGADIMIGGFGNDTYIVDQQTDVVNEATGEGTDLLRAHASYVLAAGKSIERLEIFNAAGVNPISLAGNELDQTLAGNAGANLLNGGGGDDVLIGGAGADQLVGGPGSDTASYAGAAARVKVALDNSIVFEGDALGDTFSSIARLAGTSLSDILIGDLNGNVINGGSGADTIRGQAGNDLIYGDGGGDNISGNSGDDRFSYLALSDGGDTINDFNNAVGNNDIFNFKGTAFGALSAGALAANRFVANTTGAATTVDHRFIYETDTGILRFDANGVTAGGVTIIATLTGAPVLTIADFAIT